MTSSHPTALLAELLAHREWVRRVARVLVRDEATAEDLEQEVWRKAVERPPRDARSPLAWLGTVLRSTAADLRRAALRRATHETSAARPECVTPTDVVVATEMHERVVRAVLGLDEPCRTTMLLRWFEDLAPAEIARRQGVPLETVRTRLRRGVTTLRAQLCTEADRPALVLFAAGVPGSMWGDAAGSAGSAAGGVAVGTSTKFAVAAAVLALAVAGFLTQSILEDGAGHAAPDVADGADADARSPVTRRETPRDRTARGGRPRAAPPTVETPPTAASVPSVADRFRAPAPAADAAARRVAGRVVDDTGRPVTDARIEVMDAHPTIPGGGAWHVLRTGADGRFEIADLKLERTTVRVYAPGFCFTSVDATRGAADLAIPLVRGGAISGIVVDRATGAAIAGAHVALSATDTPSGNSVFTATTADDGRFRAEGLRSAAYRIMIGFRAQPGPAAEYVAFVRETTPLSDAEIRIELDRGLPIAGVLVGDRGAPPASPQTIEAIALDEHGVPDFVRGRVVTVAGGGDGRFRIPGLAPGRHDLKVSPVDAPKAGEPAASVVWVRGVASGESDLRITLEGGRVLRGTVVDDRGEPVLESGTLFVFAAGSVTTDMSQSIQVRAAAGRFESPALPEGGGWDVYAMYFKGYGRATFRGVRHDEPLRVVLPRTVRIAGRVVDEAGKPVAAGVPVYVRAEDVVATRDGAATVVETDASGAFAVDIGEFTFGLHAGGGGSVYAGGPVVRGVKPGRSDVVLAVRAGVALAGRLVDAEGRPFRTHHLAARPAAPGVPPNEVAPAWTRVDDEDGRFSLRGLPRGRVALWCYRGVEVVQLGEFTAPAEDLVVRLPAK